ncbi:hypothetical protein EYF80_040663 [Liparis tanakae]|uniref:Uncharacterized protein n=1 Tax=Liparis tanakae TaxID=230148 RepID=A0A4Z2G7A1_9TELE|nr:hypothetical protein EYF80_040663 [Liparis tanakae]
MDRRWHIKQRQLRVRPVQRFRNVTREVQLQDGLEQRVGAEREVKAELHHAGGLAELHGAVGDLVTHHLRQRRRLEKLFALWLNLNPQPADNDNSCPWDLCPSPSPSSLATSQTNVFFVSLKPGVQPVSLHLSLTPCRRVTLSITITVADDKRLRQESLKSVNLERVPRDKQKLSLQQEDCVEEEEMHFDFKQWKKEKEDTEEKDAHETQQHFN